MPQLLTTNTKLVKGSGLPCYGVQLAPHRLSGYNVCPMASDKNTPNNLEDCIEYLKDGGIVAVPFTTKKGKDLPKTWHGFPVVDGDIHDRIWTRPGGHVLGLRFKGDRKQIAGGCKDYCIYTSGHGKFDSVKGARLYRTRLLFEAQNLFFDQAGQEIKKAETKDGKIAVRMNVFSDVAWETRAFHGNMGMTIMAKFPNVQFYDYTKIPKRAQSFLKGLMPDNYFLVLSYNKVETVET